MAERTGSTGPGGAVLRAAAPGDADFLVEMLLAAANWDPARPPVDRATALADRTTARYVAGWGRPGDLGVLAEGRTGRPVGAAWLRLFPTEDAGYGFVSPEVPELTLGVVAERRGMGLGRTLLRELLVRAAAGFDRISLSVERANHAARLYAAEGFVTVDSGPDADTMVRTLTRQRT